MALWDGRFAGETDRLVWRFNQSLPFDRRLWREDITGSIAHARMLAKQGIISVEEGRTLVDGLSDLYDDLYSGEVTLPEEAEDIHSAIEQMLKERVGPVAGKLHTARSRNDQVATDIRLWFKKALVDLRRELKLLRTQLLTLSESHLGVVLPGRTHHQHAQPVLLSHHLLAYFWMFTRDDDRLSDIVRRADALPLGAGALAGTPFPIDREFVARELGFATVIPNSMDAVADRDFALEFCAAASVLMMHLSRMAEEIVLWSSPEFGFLELGDEVTTGSSIMPQKKNPDVSELIRGKTGRVYGNTVNLLTLMKGLVLTYNKDMQEDKEPLFDTFDTVLACTTLMRRQWESAVFKPDRMRQALHGDFSTATDLADALAAEGVPFREAHATVGRIVRDCLSRGRVLEDLSVEDLRQFDRRFSESALSAILPLASANARTSAGGTAQKQVELQIEQARVLLTSSEV
ncbi:MAG: argininosuccinate lyase [Bacteroidia bacterium]|nr:argininosuccinate lyase [Bacteroidia bacterium]